MALIQRGSKWYTELLIDGKLKRESTGTSDRAVAEQIHEVRKARLALLAAGITVPSAATAVDGERTWDKAVERWLDENAQKRSIKDDERNTKWLSQYFAGRPLASLTRDEIMGVLKKKMIEASPSTANRYLATVRAILNRACNEWRWIEYAPKLRAWKEPPGRDRWLGQDEIDRLLAELPQHQRDMAGFMLATGIRWGACKGLTWDRVQLDRGFAWIDHATSKTGKPIPVPLNENAKAILQAQKGKHDRFVFTYNGEPISSRGLGTMAFRKALKRAGITGFRPHDLRHTWASHHVMNGTPLEIVKELGGWSDLKMPQRYAHLSVAKLQQFVGNAAR